ncbi:GNAT family N-acetyltransferase [Marinomonas sp. PE14-40]|uniref:GNAT family N-acetyltransferase n=1 Tax=Marinomonas sp. PE14-40 TaxID=3060621 RepID=UPI003F672B89
MEFISPTSVLENAFLRFYRDFELSDPINSLHYEAARIGFKSYVNQLKDEAQGIYNAEGKVRCNHYWLINDHHEIMAVLRIRHHIDTPYLSSEGGHISLDVSPRFRKQGIAKQALYLAKQKLRRLDIENALITADESNVAARKAIEASGGKLESIINGRVNFKPIARYWISTHTQKTNQTMPFAELA